MIFNPKEHIETILEYSKNNKLEIKEFGRFKTLNYSREVQYSGEWDFVTLNCRGLILDENWNVVGRSFPKFFNDGEKENSNITISDLYNLKDVYIQEKLDGSLGIMFYDIVEQKWLISTKGSLESDQAIWAMNWYNNNVHLFKHLNNPNMSYIFEIVYNENKIVCSYEKEGLYLLTQFNNHTGKEVPFNSINYPLQPQTYTLEQFESMYHNQDSMVGLFEGFVVRYLDKNKEISDGYYKRIKYKYDKYVKLHKIKSNLTYERLYDMYINGEIEIYEKHLIEILPDELYDNLKLAIKRVIDDVKEKQEDLDIYIDSLYNTIIFYFESIYNNDSDYYCANTNKILYKVNVNEDSIGKKIDFYFRYLGYYKTEKEKYLPFLFEKYNNGRLKDKVVYNYFLPDYANELIF